jgi:hypothetical protein
MKNRKFHIILKSSKQKWKQMQNRYPKIYTDTSIKSDGVKLEITKSRISIHLVPLGTDYIICASLASD